MGMISKKAGGASALGFALGAAMMMGQVASAAVETLDFVGFTDVVVGEQAVEAATSINPLFDKTFMPIINKALGYGGTTGNLLSQLTEAPWAYLNGGGAVGGFQREAQRFKQT